MNEKNLWSLLVILIATPTKAFVLTPAIQKPTFRLSNVKVGLSARNSPLENDGDERSFRQSFFRDFLNPLIATVAASTVFLSASTILPIPSNAAEVVLSTGAVVIQTSTPSGKSLFQAEVDAQGLLKTAFANRKELSRSVNAIAADIKSELSSPAWTEIFREILQVEGDVAPSVSVTPPSDVRQTLNDISRGKLNIILNGEIVNLSVEESTTKSGETRRDELIVRVKGVKGVPVKMQEETLIAKSRLQQQIEFVSNFFSTPLPLPSPVTKVLPEEFVLTVGNAIFASTVTFVGGSYAAAYSYYISNIEKAERQAEEKRKQMAEKRAAQMKEVEAKKAKEESNQA